jgi:hypothetical protein
MCEGKKLAFKSFKLLTMREKVCEHVEGFGT